MTELKQFEDNKVFLWGLKQASSKLLKEFDKGNKNPFSIAHKKEKEEEPKETIKKTKKEPKKEIKREFDLNEDYGIKDLDFLNAEYDRIEEELNNARGDEEERLMDLQEKLTDLIDGLMAMKKVSGGRLVKGSKEAKEFGQRMKEAREAKRQQNAPKIEEEKKKKETEKQAKQEAKVAKRKPWYYLGDIPKGYREANEDEAIKANKVSEYGKYTVDKTKYDIYQKYKILPSTLLTQTELNLNLSIAKRKALRALEDIEIYEAKMGTPKYGDKFKWKLEEAKEDYKLLNKVYNALLKLAFTRANKPFTKVVLKLPPKPEIKYTPTDLSKFKPLPKPIDPRTGKPVEDYNPDKKEKNKYYFKRGSEELILNDTHFKNNILKSKIAKKLFEKHIIIPSEYYSPDDYEKYHYKLVSKGTGIFDSLKDLGIYKEYRTPMENITKPLFDPLIDVNYSSTDFTKKAKEILKFVGDKPLVNITIQRVPVPETLKSMINIVSQGEFKKRLDELPYDDLYHLSLIMTTNDNKIFSIEKNDVVNLDMPPPKQNKPLLKKVDNLPSGITVNQMINNYISKKGRESFFIYDGATNNCQNFVLNMLKMSNIGNDEDYELIKQKTDAIFEDLEGTKGVMKGITDFSGRLRGLFGGDINSLKNKRILNDISMLKKGNISQKILDSDSDSDSSSSSSSDDDSISKIKKMIKKIKMAKKGKGLRTLHHVGQEEPEHKGGALSDYLNPIKNALKTSWNKQPETKEEREATKFIVKDLMPAFSQVAEIVAPPVGKVASKTSEILSKHYGMGFKPKETVHIDINSHNVKDGEYTMGDGLKKKKRRGRPRKVQKIEVIHKLPFESELSKTTNASLNQLINARNQADMLNFQTNISDMAKYIKDDMQGQIKKLKYERDFLRDTNPYMQGAVGGYGVKKRFVKGSQEAKDHMAKIRAMKKK